jgi:hypothetical protein
MIIFIFSASFFLAEAASNQHMMVVDLISTNPTTPTVIAAQVCMGLFNRYSSIAGAAYSLLHQPYDSQWLADLEGITNPVLTPIPQFLTKCLTARAADGSLMTSGYIRFNYTSQQLITPNIITLAAVLNALPLEDNDPNIGSASLVFDAVKEFAGFGLYEATAYMLDNYVNQTTALAFMNPGI